MEIPRGDWPVLFDLLDEALELPDEVARERWLRALTGPHRRLRSALRVLLARHDRAEVQELRQAQQFGAHLARHETRLARSAAAQRLVHDVERCLREEPEPGASLRRRWTTAALRRSKLPVLFAVTILLGLGHVRCSDDAGTALTAPLHRAEPEVAGLPNISVAPPPSRRYIPSPTEGAKQ